MTLEKKYKFQEYSSFLIYDISNIPEDEKVREDFLATTKTTFKDIAKLNPELDYEDHEAITIIKNCFESAVSGSLSGNKADRNRAEELICNLITKYS